MKYVITITEMGDNESSNVIRYQQILDSINIHAIVSAVLDSSFEIEPAASPLDLPPAPARKRAKRSDAGKPRRKEKSAMAVPADAISPL